MKPKSRAFRPGAIRLEPRALMSVVQVAPQAATATAVAGQIQGRYQAGKDNRAADAPLHIKLTGAGRVQGPVKLTGSLDLGGFRVINAQDVTGTVRLSNAKGSITLALSGSGGFASVPNSRLTLDATVVSGTGIYSTLHGTGIATAVFGKNTLRARAANAPIAGPASFSLNLNATIG